MDNLPAGVYVLPFKRAAMLKTVTLQPYQQRVADRLAGNDQKLLVYHGLGTGKTLSSILAAQQAGGRYGAVVPASLRDNYIDEAARFTDGQQPEVLSYTGAGAGKQFSNPLDTLVVDEVSRIRNPNTASSEAVKRLAAASRRVMLLSGTPVVNRPGDLAVPLSILTGQNISPEGFESRFVDEQSKWPGLLGYLRGVSSGTEQNIKNVSRLKELLAGHVDYQPGASPEGVDVQRETIPVGLSAAQQRIQDVVRRKIPTSFLWKLDRQFPLSRSESQRLGAFLTGLRQVSLSPRSFQRDPDDLAAFDQSDKLQSALAHLKAQFSGDDRRKAIIYSNFIGAGLNPYLAGLKRDGILADVYHGGLSTAVRKQRLADYNAGRIRALLIGPAGAEGISTKGTNLIQLLDPHWNEARSEQASGRGLRFDSHDGLPEDLKNVTVQRFVTTSKEPSWLGRRLGYRRQLTGDEIVGNLAQAKERLNEQFRTVLRDVGSQR